MKFKILFILAVCSFIFSCSKDNKLTEAALETYSNLTAQEIMNLENEMNDDLIQSTHGSKNEIPKYAILVFKTGDGNYGKMQFLNNDEKENKLEFKYHLFDADLETVIETGLSMVQRTYTFDFETNMQATDTEDFWWEWNEFNNGGQDGTDIFLVPWNDCIFHIYLN